jgi:hypothetical protein
LFTVITVDAVPLNAFVAVNVTVYVPDCEKFGVQLNVPEVFPVPGVNVAPVGSPEAASVVIACPSGSDADTVNVSSAFSFTVWVGGAVTVGARSTLFTVITVWADPLSVFVAVNVTVYVPDCEKFGVQLNVPDVFPVTGVNDAPVGSPDAASVVIAGPSASDADTVNVSSAFSFTVCVDGAVTTGAAPAPIVITVLAVPDSALLAVNVTVNVPV